jgi:hypothetical protein
VLRTAKPVDTQLIAQNQQKYLIRVACVLSRNGLSFDF